MNKNIFTNIIDAGGRYGIHPSWKPFSGEMNYFLFEPDSKEAERLKNKYKNRPKEVQVLPQALSDKEGITRINILRNKALSSSCERNPIIVSYMDERSNEPDIIGHEDATTTTIDDFCNRRALKIDFLKLDTEGSEYLILKGAQQQLNKNVLGVRCEVAFDFIFKNMPLFSTIHDFMLGHNFFLLNLGYNGCGDYCNDFVETKSHYGILTNCDAVWLKRRSFLFENETKKNDEILISILKYAAFCINNSGIDVAIDILLHARLQKLLDFTCLNKTRLYQFLDKSLHSHFYKLKWQPGQSIKKHQEVYFIIFGKPMLAMHEFNESLEMNPE